MKTQVLLLPNQNIAMQAWKTIGLMIFAMFISLTARAQTVVDIIVNSPDHETLESAVIDADLAGTLSGEGPFTVFAPTDAAFAALPAGTLEGLTTQELTDILLYHVIGANVASGSLTDGQSATTLNGDVFVTKTSTTVFINNAKVTVADIPADNGVVHVIDAVLLTPPPASVVDIVVNSPDHETLESAVIDAGLAGTLSGEGPFTVFAPTDAAFAALPAGTLEGLTTGELTDILLYHVVGAKVASDDLSDGQTASTLLNKDITVSVSEDGIFINDAQVIVSDIIAQNGIVHVIDAVMLPPLPETVVDIVVGSPDHGTLESAVIDAGLAGTLSGEGPFTVFAPTDAAFAALPAGFLDGLSTEELTDILLYHVIDAKVMSGTLSDGQTAATLQGKDVTVTISGDDIFINGAKVTVADIEAQNGVVHVIDAVLTPPTTVVDIIIDSEVHDSLETAVVAAGLVDALSAEGPFTVFAPTDAAFDALGEDTWNALTADPAGALANILQYHVVSGKVMDTDLSDGQIVTMLEGTDSFISLLDNAYINQAMITMTNIEADNGVVHVIDAVITQPASIVDIVANSPRHNTLETAVVEAQLADALSADGTFTLFAPTDAAFEAIGDETLTTLLADPTGDLAEILKYHVVGAIAFSTDLEDGDMFTTLEGSDIDVTINMDGVFINDAQVIFADYEAPNGVVHIIDAVIIPEGDATSVANRMIEVSEANVYPNPARDRFNVAFEMSNSSNVSIEIYNMQGQMMESRNLGNRTEGLNEIEFRTDAMDNGVYILIVNTEESVFTSKVRVVK